MKFLIRLAFSVAFLMTSTAFAFAQRADVLCVQQSLLDAGHDPNGVDGVFGRGTRTASISYLEASARNLPDLSIVSAATWCRALADAGALEGDVIIVSSDAKQSVWEMVEVALRASRNRIETKLGLNPPPLQAYLSADAEWLTKNYLRSNNLPESYRMGKMSEFGRCEPAAEAGLGVMFLCQENTRWSDDSNAIHMSAHEFWHTAVQYYLVDQRCCSDPDAMSLFGPEWLVEGSAEYFATSVREDLGMGSLKREMIEYENRIDPNINLTELQTRRGFRENDGWNAGPVAVSFLVETRGIESIVEYYKAIGAGEEIETAFRLAFGSTTDDLAIEFRSFLGR
ncbi:MAG: peptidoglycan-binding protein [Paracoccaceae bacterium]